MATATQTPPTDATEVRMTFGEHLEELRWRLVKSLIALFVAFVVSTIFYQDLVTFVVRPHHRVMDWLNIHGPEADLITGSYTKPIWAAMKLSFIVALFAASPIIAWQGWRFVAAGLYP